MYLPTKNRNLNVYKSTFFGLYLGNMTLMIPTYYRHSSLLNIAFVCYVPK